MMPVCPARGPSHSSDYSHLRDLSGPRWHAAQDAALQLADRRAAKARALGWDSSDVFGLNPTQPASRLDQWGLAWLLGDGSEVTGIDRHGADIETPGGRRLRFYRKPT